jgi:hypothetical protein
MSSPINGATAGAATIIPAPIAIMLKLKLFFKSANILPC